jgi:hypothetical protein
MKPIAQVLAERTPALLEIDGVVGTAEGAREGQPVFVVLIRRDDPGVRRRLPDRVEGYPVEVRVVGDVRPLSTR